MSGQFYDSPQQKALCICYILSLKLIENQEILVKTKNLDLFLFVDILEGQLTKSRLREP